MASRTIPQGEWRAFFDSMADDLVGKRAEVEAASLDFGDQIVAEWVPCWASLTTHKTICSMWL